MKDLSRLRHTSVQDYCKGEIIVNDIVNIIVQIKRILKNTQKKFSI